MGGLPIRCYDLQFCCGTRAKLSHLHVQSALKASAPGGAAGGAARPAQKPTIALKSFGALPARS
jgi:hypothetical protein